MLSRKTGIQVRSAGVGGNAQSTSSVSVEPCGEVQQLLLFGAQRLVTPVVRGVRRMWRLWVGGVAVGQGWRRDAALKRG